MRQELLHEPILPQITTHACRSLVGYARVSTTRQMNEGESLVTQESLIREYAAQMNRDLVGLYIDSTSGARPFTKRPTLLDAIAQAETLGCPILVASPDRLSRNVDILERLDLRKTQVWVVGRGRLSREELTREIGEAAHALGQRREAGASSWSPTARKKRNAPVNLLVRAGGLAGSKANKTRSDTNVSRIVSVLEAQPDAMSMTCRQLAQFLNDQGITNKNGRDHAEPVLWTTATLRRPWRRARRAIEAKSAHQSFLVFATAGTG